jgi:hypothetical protein
MRDFLFFFLVSTEAAPRIGQYATSINFFLILSVVCLDIKELVVNWLEWEIKITNKAQDTKRITHRDKNTSTQI